MSGYEYLRRCAQLYDRGATDPLVRDLREAGDPELLAKFEGGSDAQLVQASEDYAAYRRGADTMRRLNQEGDA